MSAQVRPGRDMATGLASWRRRAGVVLFGTALLLNAWIARWVYADNPAAADIAATLAALVLGAPVLWHAAAGLRRGERSLNELVAIGLLAALVQGDMVAAAAVALFLHLGQLLESRSAVGAREAVEQVMRLAPAVAHRLGPNGQTSEVPARELAPGDLIRIRAGEQVAADGVITRGVTTLDQASVTGESLPVDRGVGDAVFAGTVNVTGTIDVEVTRVGADTTLGRVRQLILEAEASRLPVQRAMDRYAGYYTPTVLMLAGLAWFFTNDASRVVAMLVIAVPGAFVLAAPTAVVAALSAASRLGVLVKSVEHLETAARIDAWLFDKTGTLTTGELAVSRRPEPLGDLTVAELLRLAASAEQGSRHPAARALVALAAEHRVPLAQPDDFREAAGRGIAARVDGREVRAGTGEWMLEAGVDPVRFGVPDEVMAAGVSLVYVLADGAPAGWFALGDRPRDEAREAIAELRGGGAGLVAMVTGDRGAVAEQMARRLAVDEVRAERLPEEKVDYVHEVQQRGWHVGMVGDGVNDGAALAAADLGLAVAAAGNDIALSTADIALLNDNLRLVPFLSALARRTRTVINQNLAIGLLFIVVGLALSGLGWVSPVLAAFLRNVDEVFVLFSSARLLRAGEELDAVTTEPTPAEADGRPARETVEVTQ